MSLSIQSHFSHIYVESAAQDEPMAIEILARFPRATVVEIEDYRDIFGRSGQDFQLQKQSKKLILARKKDNLLYSGNDKVQDYGYKNFHYNTLLLNCLYNCSYCYLQGMLPSANLVAFVNEEEFFAATRRAIVERSDKTSPLYLAISYDTDLLASEGVLPYSQRWIEFARGEKDLLIELRTKSANYAALQNTEAHPRAIISWTLSPQSVIDQYEQGTPSLEARLRAIEKTMTAGWEVRLCFDPVLHIPNWELVYGKFFKSLFAQLPLEKIRDVSLGLFRMNADYFNKLKRTRPDSDIVYAQYEREHNTMTLPTAQRKLMTETLVGQLQNFLPSEKIEVWT